MKSLLNLIINIFTWFFNLLKELGRKIIEKFLEINVFEKGIVIVTILAFAAVVAPMAQYRIFDSFFTINNPAAHYMIGIVLVMLVTVYFPGLIAMGVRVVLNILFLADIIYLQAAHEISKAPYELTWGYYLNIIVPAVYILLSLGSAFMRRES